MFLSRIAKHRSKSFLALAGIVVVVLARRGFGPGSSLNGWLTRFTGIVIGIAILGGVVLIEVLIGMAVCDERSRPGSNGWWLAGVLVVLPVAFWWASTFVRSMLAVAGKTMNER